MLLPALDHLDPREPRSRRYRRPASTSEADRPRTSTASRGDGSSRPEDSARTQPSIELAVVTGARSLEPRSRAARRPPERRRHRTGHPEDRPAECLSRTAGGAGCAPTRTTTPSACATAKTSTAPAATTQAVEGPRAAMAGCRPVTASSTARVRARSSLMRRRSVRCRARPGRSASSWVPRWTTVPRSSTTISSQSRIVLSRWATIRHVQPRRRRAARR